MGCGVMDVIKYIATLRTLAEQAAKQAHEQDNDRMRGYRLGRIDALSEVLELLKALETK